MRDLILTFIINIKEVKASFKKVNVKIATKYRYKLKQINK